MHSGAQALTWGTDELSERSPETHNSFSQGPPEEGLEQVIVKLY